MRGAEGGQCAGEAGSGGDPEAVAADAAGGVSEGPTAGEIGRGVCGAGVAGGVRAGRAGVRDVPGREPDAEAGGGGTDGADVEGIPADGETPAGALRRLFVWSEELEAEAAGGDAGRPGTAAGAQAEGKPAVRGDQRQGRSAADLPTDLLSARRSGEPHQGTQGGGGDGPGELHEFLCEPVPGAAVGGRLCLAAGVAVAGSGDALRQDAGGGAAAVPVEVGGVGEEFDAAGRAEPAQGGAIRVGVAADCQESGSGAD